MESAPILSVHRLAGLEIAEADRCDIYRWVIQFHLQLSPFSLAISESGISQLAATALMDAGRYDGLGSCYILNRQHLEYWLEIVGLHGTRASGQ